MKKVFILFILALLGIFLFSVIAHSQADSEAENFFGNDTEADVIVLLKENPMPGKSALAHEGFSERIMMINDIQQKTFRELRPDFELKNTFSTVSGFTGKLKKSSFEKMRSNPNVLRIIKPRKLELLLSDSKGIVNATQAWKMIYNATNITGKGQSVCVIDTGVDYTHPNLGNCSSSDFVNNLCPKVIRGYDFSNNYDNDPMDERGHGTHVAGIIASSNDTYRGIAPEANIIAMKIFNASGTAFDSDLISAIDWCVYNASLYNISVISMSIGVEDYTNSTYCDSSDNPLLVDAIHNAVAANISVVVAAGNDNIADGVSSPACITNVTVVGSTTKTDSTSAFSDRWSLPMIFAPGTNIVSLKPSSLCLSGCSSCSDYQMTCSGTSMATPHVSGVFALLGQFTKLQKNKKLTASQLFNATNSTGLVFADSINGLQYSRINAFRALSSLDSFAANITFVNPTPANNTNISFVEANNYVFFSLTSDEVLLSAILEINNGSNVNITMSINGLNSYINLSGLKNGVRIYRVYANDSGNNFFVSGQMALQINNTAPNIAGFFPNDEFVSITEPMNQTFEINATDFENDSLAYYWYMNNSLLNKSGSQYNFTGNSSSSGFYTINVTASDSSQIMSRAWNFSVNRSNLNPSVTSAFIQNSDILNRTNGSLTAAFSYTDEDNDAIAANETLWYINETLAEDYTNRTFIDQSNTTKLQRWAFSVRVSDGFGWSEFFNSSNITIIDSPPIISSINQTPLILETEKINITVNSDDLDADPLIFSSNKSELIMEGLSFIWNTNTSSSGIYIVNITVNSSNLTESTIVNFTVADADDLDGDGNPDFNDTDDDNDNVNDTFDYLNGDLSSINISIPFNLTVNGTSNFSKMFNGTFYINISNGNSTFIEFNFSFNSSSILSLANLTINRTVSGSSAVSIRGLINLGNSTKTFFLEKVNTTVNSVCVKDADASFESISSSCNSANEMLVVCNNQTQGQYSCYDLGARYMVTGLNHSAAKEQCIDSDGDTYGTGCANGNDNCDTDASTSGSCPSGGNGDNNGGGGSSGGGGGSSAFYVCSSEWQCSEWASCRDKWETRTCDFVKVGQHTQSTACPIINSVPQTSRKCSIQISSSGHSNASSACTDCENETQEDSQNGLAIQSSLGSKKIGPQTEGKKLNRKIIAVAVFAPVLLLGGFLLFLTKRKN